MGVAVGKNGCLCKRTDFFTGVKMAGCFCAVKK